MSRDAAAARISILREDARHGVALLKPDMQVWKLQVLEMGERHGQ